jgi:hypothetical protein
MLKMRVLLQSCAAAFGGGSEIYPEGVIAGLLSQLQLQRVQDGRLGRGKARCEFHQQPKSLHANVDVATSLRI